MHYFALSIENASYEAVRNYLCRAIDDKVGGVALLIFKDGRSIGVTEIEEISPDHEFHPYRLIFRGEAGRGHEWLVELRLDDNKPLMIDGECKDHAKEYGERIIELLNSHFSVKELSPEAPRQLCLTWKYNSKLDIDAQRETHEQSDAEELPGRHVGSSIDGHDKNIQNELIDKACLGWAGRSYLPGGNDMSEYLQSVFYETGIYLSKDQFKDALKEAGRRGIIVKKNRRWKLP